MDAEEKKPRKSYSREFKIEAVRMTTEGGVPVAQAAQDLEINENTLHNWRRQFRQWGAAPNAGKEALSQAEEIQRLRRENAKLREERDFLKRAAVWLAKEAH
jgi:transposase